MARSRLRRKINSMAAYYENGYNGIAKELDISRPLLYQKIEHMKLSHLETFIKLCDVCEFSISLKKGKSIVPITIADYNEDEELQKDRR